MKERTKNTPNTSKYTPKRHPCLNKCKRLFCDSNRFNYDVREIPKAGCICKVILCSIFFLIFASGAIAFLIKHDSKLILSAVIAVLFAFQLIFLINRLVSISKYFYECAICKKCKRVHLIEPANPIYKEDCKSPKSR